MCISRLGLIILVACITSSLTTKESAAQFSGFWLDIGEYHNVYSEGGARQEEAPGIPPGMNYPAILRESDHSWARGFWIGTKNWTDELGQIFPYYVARLGPKEPGIEFTSPVDTRIISRTEDSEVYVDGEPAFDKLAVVDEVDPRIAADRMISNTFNMDVGVTVTRNIYAYVNQFHDNYHIIEYEYCNSGNIDEDDDIELPDQTLHETYFFHMHRWRSSGQAAWTGSNGNAWGKFNMIDVVGDGHMDYPVDITAFYVWHGYEPHETQFSNLGAPLWPGVNQQWHAAIDTVGRLAGATWVGRAFLHIDSSPDNETYVKCTPSTFGTCQPHTIGWVDQDSPTADVNESHQHYYELGILSTDRPSRMFPHYADRVEPSGEFWNPTTSASAGHGSEIQGGYAPTEAIGPYEMAPGDCIAQAVAEGVDGLSYDAGVQIGRTYRRARGDDDLPIAYDANGDGQITEGAFDYSTIGLPTYQGNGCTACPARGSERMTKNEWFFTARDSLYQMFFRARDLYEMSNRMTQYPIPEAPYAPVQFEINGHPDVIELSWQPHPAGGPPIDHWEVYRTANYTDNLLDADGNGLFELASKPWGDEIITGYEKLAEISSETTRYEDRDILRGHEYFYYVVAVGLPQPVDPMAINGTPDGVPLTSSRYLTQSYRPTHLTVAREQEIDPPKSLTIETVHPNPFRSSTTIRVSAARPGPYAVKVYDDLGRIIRNFDINISASGQMPVSIDLSGQVSGVYTVQVLETRTGQTAFRRVVLVE